MIVHLIDGTYELFRHFYGLQRIGDGKERPFGAVAGVLTTVLQMAAEGATHIGVATDHVIESFRNELWPNTKPARESTRNFASSLRRWKMRSRRWASPYGR